MMNKYKILKNFIISVILLFSTVLYATPQYAQKTDQKCMLCHIDPAGGGELTDVGKGYKLSLKKSEISQEEYSKSYFKLLILFIHIFTAIFWFGTILYVHIVLKPKYASKGLPSSEMKVGISSMLVMAVTGTYLTLTTTHSFEIFYTSTFGMLLGLKIVLFMIMVLSALYVILFIAPKLKETGKRKIDFNYKSMSFNELALYNGKDGAPAYIGFKDKIYDVSNSKKWKNGEHMRKVHAGEDLTQMISQAPHGEEKVFAMPFVGKLLQNNTQKNIPLQIKVFYFMSYMNLTIVFIITLIIALWRWN